MFAALIVARLREAASAAGVQEIKSWMSPDETQAAELPLAKAAEKVLASMHAVLQKTMQSRDMEQARMGEEKERPHRDSMGEEGGGGEEMQKHLRLTKAAEVKVVRNARDLISPPDLDGFRAMAVEMTTEGDEGAKPDELGVLKTGTGEITGANHQT